MKGPRILLISITALLSCQYVASAQNDESSDTLSTAVVSATRPPVTSTGLKRLSRDDVIRGTSVLGTPDLIKTIQNLPGVSSGVELISGLYVHGGDGTDNLLLLDGVPLFQVSHLAGLFSSFNTDIIKTTDFYTSGFPARFGGKISSIVDVVTDDGSLDRFGGSFSVGLIDAKVAVNGPIVRDKLSYNIAVRRSLLDAVVAPVLAFVNKGNKTQTKGNYVLFDTNLNLLYTPTAMDKVDFHFFSGMDAFRYGKTMEQKFYGKEIYYTDSGVDMNIKWGNIAVSSDWHHAFSQKCKLFSILYYSRGFSNIHDWQKTNEFSNEIVTTQTNMEKVFGSVNAAGAKSLVSVALEHHNISTGLEYVYSWYNPSRHVEKTCGDITTISNSGIGMLQSSEFSFFVEDDMNYGAFHINTGVRLDTYRANGVTYFRPQPRISASYSITDNIIAKASCESISQYSHLLSSLYLDLPTNLWVPSTKKIKPSDSRQVAAGFHTHFSKCWSIDVGGYYRSISNCLIYSGAGSLFPSVDRWEEEMMSGRGRSYGLESEVKYLSERFLGDVRYTLSWSERYFPDLHETWFPDRFDNRHKITVSGTFKLRPDIDISATWNYHSGNRVTLPEHIMNTPGGGTDYLYSQPYNAKIPDYHRLDLSCSFHRRTKHGNEGIWNISIYNAYCRMNPIIMLASRDENNKPVAIMYSLVPIIPSFSYSLRF